MATADEPQRFIPRGDKGQSIAGTLTFIGLRAADPFLTYSILANGLGQGLIISLGGSIVAQGPVSNTGIAGIDSLGLSPYRLALLAMTVAGFEKHLIWKLFIGEERMPPGTAAMAGTSNTIFSILSVLAFTCTATSAATQSGEGPGAPGWPGAPLVVGSILVAAGVVTELVSELQRKAFKNDLRNKDKPFTGGMFGLARHINYGAFTLWRSGIALAAGGWLCGALWATFFIYNFSTRGIPELDSYCRKRYGAMWSEYKKKTPYMLLPFIY